MRPDQIGVNPVTHDILKNSVLFGQSEGVEASPVEIGDARHECEAERMTEGEYKIADAAAIDVVSDNIKASVGFQQCVKHVNGFTCRCGDDFGIDRKSTRLNSSHQIISYAVF